MDTVPVLSWEWADWIEPAIYQINDVPLVIPCTSARLTTLLGD
jgi:hypothetical protein